MDNMDNIAEIIRALPAVDIPANLHAGIMQRVMLYKIRRWTTYGLILSALNLALSFWHVIARIIDKDGVTIIRSLIQDFQVDLSYWEYVVDVIQTALPVGAIVVLLSAVLMMALLLGFLLFINKQLKKGRELSLIKV